MAFWRQTAVWSGPGGPGVSHLDYRGVPGDLGNPDHNAIALAWQSYFNTLKGYMPNEWSVGVVAEVAALDDNGEITETVTITGLSGAIAGTYSGSWAGAVGVCTRFNTAEFVGGRRIKGKTFFVPAGSTVAFDQDGTLNSTALTDFLSARNTLHNAIAAEDGIPVVFSPTHHLTADITGINIADRSAVLRSRRD